MIYITGDTHGNFVRFSMDAFPEQAEMTKEDIVIICGDFGGNWDIVSKIIAETLTDVNALICAYGKNEGNWYR